MTSAEGPTTDRILVEHLVPSDWNPRTITSPQFESLKRSIEADPDFMWQRPIIALANGTVIAGNMRLRAVIDLGWTHVPAIIDDISEELAKSRALRDNNAWGEWQEDDLSVLLHDLESTEDLGFDDGYLERLLESTGSGNPGTGDPDAIPPEPEPVTKPGELWILGDHRLLCGDATNAEDVERLLAGEKPALMLTDPPYGVDYDPNWRNEAADKGLIAHAASRVGTVSNDDRIDWSAAWHLAPAVISYVWHADRHASEVQASLEEEEFEIRCQIVWAKSRFAISRGHYHWQHEPCWYAVRKGAGASWIGDRKQTTLWGVTLDQNVEGGHSTQKPVELFAIPLRNHEGDVYDPFVGSGTAIIAAEQAGRRCYAMDIEPKYCDVAIARWEQFTGREAVRGSDVETD